MKPEQISQTKVWRINESTLVVAETIPMAIEIYETHYPFDNVEKVELVKGKWDSEYALMLENHNDL